MAAYDGFTLTQKAAAMKAQVAANPFALMMDPQTVLQAMERSERLQRLQRHVCRPLDKPLIPCVDGENDDTDAFDRDIDAAPDTQLGDTLIG